MKKTKDKKTGYLILLAVLFAVPQLAMAATYQNVNDVFYDFNWDWIKLQVRSCSQSDCSDGSWIGSDNTSGTWFTNSTFGDLSKTNIPDSRYFQWKAFFITTDTGKTPKLDSITLTTTPITDIAYDKSGNGNDGKLKNFDWTAYSGWTAGKFGGGLQFDGINDYVNCSNNPSLDITDAITISAWVKPNALGWKSIISSLQGDMNDCGLWIVSSNELRFRTSSTTTFKDYKTTNANMQTGNWYHIVAVRRSDTSKNIYLNGNVLTATDNGNAWSSSIKNLKIGARNDLAAGYWFNGAIDEVRIYNRALTPDQTVVMKRVG